MIKILLQVRLLVGVLKAVGTRDLNCSDGEDIFSQLFLFSIVSDVVLCLGTSD